MSLVHIAPGLYKDALRGTLYERPKLANGRWTYRKLNARTIKLAQEERFQRRQQQVKALLGTAPDPYAPPPPLISALIEEWEQAGFPTVKLKQRQGRAAQVQASFIQKIGGKLGGRLANSITPQDLTAYAESRRPYTRAADCEVQSLVTCLKWAYRTGRLPKLPDLTTRTRLHVYRRHARDTMPVSPQELANIARWFFESDRGQALGWQLLLEALTGCRTGEILALRWDAGPREPGCIEGEWLWLCRSKGGVNPFALIHPALRSTLDACRQWGLAQKHPSPWFVPGWVKGQHMDMGALTHALKDVPPELLSHPVTSHGLRAHYVTVRRSQGASDAQIAAEIGDRTGAAIIASTYGAIPPNWQGNGATLSWLPEGEPPWQPLELPRNLVAA